jgi:DNA repair photolyase
MRMIINTGMRTDIPAYFSEWFYNRIREGYVLTRNPYYPQQVSRYRLTPDVVDCLSFCTKNPEPMLKRIHEIDAFRQFWFVTITPYGKEIEPHVPDKKRVMEAFLRLSEHVGIRSIGWRYDPIFLTGKYDLEFHIRSFEEMAAVLSGSVDQCVISFLDLYVKTRRNFPEGREVSREEREILAREFVKTGKKYGIQIRTCCEGTELARFGVDVQGCMTKQVMERAIGESLDIPMKKKALRDGCSCLLGNDIGMYNTCSHGCVYCYANDNQEMVRRNVRLHDPASPFLIGGYREEDKIKEAKQESYLCGQLTLF